MKELKLYACETCGTQYKEKKKALECEERHKISMEVRSEKHHAGGDYPDRVEIRFTDGKCIWYKR